MKRNILHTLWAAAVLLTACTQEELPLPGTNNAAPLTITIIDGGYAPTASAGGMQKAITRATENGYRTEFTAGDICGLYIVRNGVIVHNNVKLTATAAGTGGSLTWESGETLAGGMADEHYLLYYPYQADMTGKVTASATSDADFFATLISGWLPTADQSDYAAGYTASDLMTATGTAAENGNMRQLTFAMTHRMALAVIEMPKTVYKFTDTSIPDYTVPTAADFTAEAKPCRNSDGTYRYLVNPSQTAPSLTGSYADGKKEFTITPSGIAASNYKTYRVDRAQPVEKNHDLQVGDYLLADGSLVGKDALTEEQKASVSAIVFWTPSETDYTSGRQTAASLEDDKIMSAAHPDCTHGLAVAVKALTYNSKALISWQQKNNGSYGDVDMWQAEQEQYAPSPDGFVSVASNSGATDNINRIYGYQNTLVLRAYNAYCLNTPAKVNSVVQPVAALDEFVNSNACPAPPNSTGWFLPSAKELHMLCYKGVDHIWNGYGFETRDIVNTSLAAVGGVALEADYYWSSSEYESLSGYAFNVSFSNASVSSPSKSGTRRARAVCAF